MYKQSIHYHRKPLRLLNRMWQGLNAVGLARIALEENLLIDSARRETGLTDFGDDYFLEPMRILLRSLNQEARLNPLGRYLSRVNILRLLKHRLYLQDLLKSHPGILERAMPDPVVIVGLARSGTTRLHRLLAADERFLHLKSWESVYPVPWPQVLSARDNNQVDPRIRALDQGLKAVLYASPQVAAVHPLGTFEVEEEVGLIQHGFSTQIFEIQAKIPSFAEWLMTHDQTAAYQDMARLLKVISWYRGDPQDKPWVLKSPQHMQDLDAMLRVFPNAKLVFSHRDPIKAVGSACSMAWHALVRDTNSLTPDWVGPEWLSKTERMLRKTMRVRAELSPPENQYDIQYADITADWQAAMQGIYDFLDLPFTTQARQAMQSWHNSNKQHQHGAHKYQLQDFGLEEKAVDQRLMFYRSQYNIPYETSNPHLRGQHTSEELP